MERRKRRVDTARLTTKGRLAIPGAFRDALQLRLGDKVVFRLDGETLVLSQAGSAKVQLVTHSTDQRLFVVPKPGRRVDAATVKSCLVDLS